MNGDPAGAGILWISLLMLAAGVGIPVMAALNSGLGQQLQSPVAATAILFGGGLVVALAALAISGTAPPAGRFTGVPLHFYLGAVFVVFYILSITFAAPRIGLGNAIFLVLLGQLLAAALIDHFGLLGAVQSPLTWRRAAGLALMAVGVYLARKRG